MAKKETYGMKPVVNIDYGVGKKLVSRTHLLAKRDSISKQSKVIDKSYRGKKYNELKAENRKMLFGNDASIGFLNLKQDMKSPKVKEDPAVEQYRRALLGKNSEEIRKVLKSRFKK